MARLATLSHGKVDQLHRELGRCLTAEEGELLLGNPSLWNAMLATLPTRTHAPPPSRACFTPLADKIKTVKAWPGVNPADVDAAFEMAKEDGTIAGYEAEVGASPLLDIVVTVYRGSVHATLAYLYARWCDRYGSDNAWKEAYAGVIGENRVKLIPGASPFIPNRIAIEVVDFGANWDRENGLVLETIQKTQAVNLAGFAVICNGIQSPDWVKQMNGKDTPYAIAGALLLTVPGYRVYSPFVWRDGRGAGLRGGGVDGRFYGSAVPVLRKYGARS